MNQGAVTEDLEPSITAGDSSKQLRVSSLITPMDIFCTSSMVNMWIFDTTSQNSLKVKRDADYFGDSERKTQNAKQSGRKAQKLVDFRHEEMLPQLKMVKK